MIALCLAAGLLVAPLGEAVTLRWTHSIQKTVWEEDYRLADGRLLLVEARVQGTGAGMEPPDGAVLKDGAWHYRPPLPPLPGVQLRHSPHVPPYVLCAGTDCRPAPHWLPGLPDDAVLELAPCADDPATRRQ
ncbi:MAG TPA: DUF1850 domain-containing protein [Azospira sp.]|nr:DUF1850 domain-containing protein [Azospira sp.]